MVINCLLKLVIGKYVTPYPNLMFYLFSYIDTNNNLIYVRREYNLEDKTPKEWEINEK